MRLKNSFLCRISLLTLFSFFFACTHEKVKRDKPLVVSTTTLIKDLVDTLWGDQVESISLMGPGVDPHLYQPTAQDLSKLQDADCVYAHGLHLEGKMVEALEALAKKKKVVIAGHFLSAEKLVNFNGAVDPHTWFDPELWIETASFLSKNPPVEGLKSDERLEDFSKKVQAIAEKYRKEFQKIPTEKRVLITSHDAFNYLGRYFYIEVQGIQGVSTDSEVGVRRVEELIELIKKKKIPSIFSETSVSSRSIDKLISESGAKSGGTLYSDALGPVGSGADNYVGMLEHNLKTVYEGLKK